MACAASVHHLALDHRRPSRRHHGDDPRRLRRVRAALGRAQGNREPTSRLVSAMASFWWRKPASDFIGSLFCARQSDALYLTRLATAPDWRKAGRRARADRGGGRVKHGLRRDAADVARAQEPAGQPRLFRALRLCRDRRGPGSRPSALRRDGADAWVSAASAAFKPSPSSDSRRPCRGSRWSRAISGRRRPAARGPWS